MKHPFYVTQFYSMGYWMKDYAYYPQSWPLYVWMDHGVSLEDALFPDELETKALIIFKFSPRLITSLKRASKKPVYCVLNPIIHCRNKRGYKQKNGATGTLFYAAHSTGNVEDHTDWNVFIEKLGEIPEEFYPIDICLHQTDINKGLDKVFADNGYKVVTAGNTLSDEFADNMYEIMVNYKYTMSNLCGSYHAYSVELGIPFSLYGEEPVYYNTGDKNIELRHYESYKSYITYQKALSLFKGFHKEITKEQLEFVNSNLGKYNTVSRLKASYLLYKALFQYIAKYPGILIRPFKKIFAT